MTSIAPRTTGLVFGGVTLRARAVAFQKKVAIQDWQRALQFSEAMEESSPYWIGDLLAYADGRADWKAKIDQATAHTGLSRGTLHNYTTLCRKVAPAERDLAPTPKHAMIVSPLPAPQQRQYLELARTEGLNTKELASRIKRDGRTKVLDGRADGVYAVEDIVSLSIEAKSSHEAEMIAKALVKAWTEQARTDLRILTSYIGTVRTVEPRTMDEAERA